MPRPISDAPKATVTEKVIRTEERPPVEVPINQPEPEGKPDFWTYIGNLQAAEWKNHVCRVYRTPNGQPKKRELGSYLVRYDADNPLFNEEQIRKDFGGGQYDALLHNKNVLILTGRFDIEGPSKFSDQGNNPAHGNSDLAQTLQIVLANLQRLQTTPNSTESPALKESVAMLKEVAAAMPKPEGVGALVTALGSLRQITEAGGGGGGNNILETVKVLKELGIIGAPPPDPMAQLKTMLEMFTLMRGEVGASGGGGRRDWASTLIDAVPSILEKATPIVDRVADVARQNARIAELRSGRVPAAAPAVIDQTPAQPGIPAAETPQNPGAPRTVAPLETEAVNAMPQTDQPVAPNLEWLKRKVLEMFFAGKTGDLVAEFLDNLEPTLVNQLAALTAEQLEAFFRGDAILRQIAEAPRCAAFIAEFREYASGEPGDHNPN